MDALSAAQVFAKGWTATAGAVKGNCPKFFLDATEGRTSPRSDAISAVRARIDAFREPERDLDLSEAWNSVRQLASKSADKVDGAGPSADNVLQAHIGVLQSTAAAFDAAGKAYRAREDAASSTSGPQH